MLSSLVLVRFTPADKFPGAVGWRDGAVIVAAGAASVELGLRHASGAEVAMGMRAVLLLAGTPPFPSSAALALASGAKAANEAS